MSSFTVDAVLLSSFTCASETQRNRFEFTVCSVAHVYKYSASFFHFIPKTEMYDDCLVYGPIMVDSGF